MRDYDLTMCVRHLLLAATLLAPQPVTAEQSKWWQSAELQRALNLTRPQVVALDRIYDASLPERRARGTAFARCESEYEGFLKTPDLDERVAIRLIDRVENARKRKNVARTMMLFQMRRILTPAQRRILDTIAMRRP